MLKFSGKNLFTSSIHPYLFEPPIWTFKKIKCTRVKYTFVDFLYNVKATLGFVNLGKILMSIKHFSSFCRKHFSNWLFPPIKFCCHTQEYSRNRVFVPTLYLQNPHSKIMCHKIEVMNDTCSQTFTRKLEQYSSVFVSKIQEKF